MRGNPIKVPRRLSALALLIWAGVCLTGPSEVSEASEARADARFGDSTWIAPAGLIAAETTPDGRTVAPPGHERGWETALRTPFRVAFFPLRLVAKGVEAGAGYIGPRYLEPKADRPPKPGLSLSPHVTQGGPSDLGLGPAITWVGFPTSDSKLLLAGTLSASDRRYALLREVIGERRAVGFRLEAVYSYKPDRPFYGIGNNMPVTNRSYFLLESSNVEAALLLGAKPLRQFRVIGGYSSMSPRRGYNAEPLLEDVFSGTSVSYQHRTTRELWYGVAADLAAVDNDRDPSRGIHGRADLRRATGVGSGDPDYTQWRLEGRGYVPVFASRRVIAVRVVYAGIEPSGGATALPHYRLAQSEEAYAFAGYAAGRFRDRQLMLGRVEYRWAVLHGLSAIALYELGEVAPRAASFRLRDAHTSYGGGLRLGMSDGSAARFEVAKGTEGLHAVLTLVSTF